MQGRQGMIGRMGADSSARGQGTAAAGEMAGGIGMMEMMRGIGIMPMMMDIGSRMAVHVVAASPSFTPSLRSPMRRCYSGTLSQRPCVPTPKR